MKTIILFLLALFSFGALAAQEYSISAQNGERQFESLSRWGVYHGGEFSIGLGTVGSPNQNQAGQDYADMGFVGNASLLVEMNPYVSSGVDYMYSGFRTAKDAAHTQYTLSAHHISAAFKIRVNPNDKLRFYFPIGAGGGGIILKTQEIPPHQTQAVAAHQEKWSLGVYGGVGIEMDVSPTVFVGAEYRYVYSFVQESDVDLALGSNRYFQSHQLMFKIGMRLF